MALSIPIISEFDGKGIKAAIEEFKNLEGFGAKAQFAIKKAAVPAAAALAALGAVALSSVKSASDLNEEMSKSAVIFGEGATEIDKFATAAGKALGQSKVQALQASATFATLAKQTGMTGKDVVKFSKQFTVLASDLASFNNTTPEEAILALGAALRGESEPIRRYGVLLSEAAMKAKALELGIGVITKTGVVLTDQEKVLVRSKLIWEQTAAAQGDFARTSDGLANSQRQLNAQFENFKASLGQALLPVLQKVVPLFEAMADWAVKHPGAFQIIAAAIAGIAAAIVAVNVAMALNPFSLIAAGIVALGVGLVAAYKKFEGFREVINTVGEYLKWWYDNIAFPVFQGLVNTIKAVVAIVEKLVDAFKKLPDMGKGALLGPWLGRLLSFETSAGGGTVSTAGAGAVNVYVNGGDPLAVVDAIKAYNRGYGAVPITTMAV